MEQSQANIFTDILDDDVDMYEVMTSILEHYGITKNMYAFTGDPDIFLSRIDPDKINLGVIDHRLNNEVDGLKVVRDVRKINKDLYIIVITGQQDYKIVAKYIREGVNDYIDKNDDNYLDEFAQAILRGIDEAKEKIKIRDEIRAENEKIKLEMRRSNMSIDDLINKLR